MFNKLLADQQAELIKRRSFSYKNLLGSRDRERSLSQLLDVDTSMFCCFLDIIQHRKRYYKATFT